MKSTEVPQNRGNFVTVPLNKKCSPKMAELSGICSGPCEIMAGSLIVRIAGCPQNLVPLATNILTDPKFLKECADLCSLPDEPWTALATFTGPPCPALNVRLRIPTPTHDPKTLVTVFALSRSNRRWKSIHPLNNALMAMTKLLRYQMQGPCKFFATHPEAGRYLSMAQICEDDDFGATLLSALLQVLQDKFPDAKFNACFDELIQNQGQTHLFMISWEMLIQDQLEQFVFDACRQQNVLIAEVHRFSLSVKQNK